QQLAHLYILEPGHTDHKQYLQKWIYAVLEDAYALNDIMNHQDFLILDDAKEAKQYNIEHISEINQFISNKANQIDQKFLIIPYAHKLSPIHYNKLLKLFEEPPIKLTVFLLNPHKIKLLPTINSRGQNIKLKIEQNNSTSFLADIFKDDPSYTKFSKEVEKQKLTPAQLLAELAQSYAQSNQIMATELSQLQTQIKHVQEDILFNNSTQHILLKIYHYYIKLK
ncbi:MAG: hypothetical protein HON90_11570, partial [Halobacteriovoraceae bacterium]|nr:hypothetical protein [Halobacteriovoraceae bacterium]